MARSKSTRGMVLPCRTRRQRCSKNSWPTQVIKALNRLWNSRDFETQETLEPKETNEMSTTLSQQLEEYRAGWMQRVPADRRAAMERHIAHLLETGSGRSAKQVGD